MMQEELDEPTWKLSYQFQLPFTDIGHLVSTDTFRTCVI